MGGIFAVASNGNCADALFYGTDYQTHMGPEFGGLALEGEKKKPPIKRIESGQFKDKFREYHLDIKRKGRKARYGVGTISENEQPLMYDSRHGRYVIATTGRIFNQEGLAKRLIKEDNTSFGEMTSEGTHNPTEIAAKLINHGRGFEEGIRILHDEMEGALTVVLMKEGEGLYAMSSRHAHWPLTVGRNGDGYAVTTETCAFPNLDFTPERTMKPGEMLHITENGINVLEEGSDDMNVCAFLWIYTGFPASTYYGINAGEARMRCGAALARRDNGLADSLDFTAGVPDSGTYHAMGYAEEAGIPHRQPLVKYTPGYGRSYTPPTQEMRNMVASMKLIPIEELMKGMEFALLEDSIVRGTQLKNRTLGKVFGSGAKVVHVRPACPPLMFPCKYGKSTKRPEELAARRAIADMHARVLEPDEIMREGYLDPDSQPFERMIEWIGREMDEEVKVGPGRLTLMYQRMDDMIEAIGLPKEKLCTHCWDGTGV